MPTILEPITVPAGNGPISRTLTELGTVDVESAFASFDGTSASGAWRPAFTVRAQNGAIIARVFPTTEMAVGDAAVVTYGPFGIALSETTTSGGTGFNAMAEGLGAVAWSVDPAICDTTFRPSTTLQLASIVLATGDVVGHVATPLTAVEVVAPTHAYMGLYDSSYNLLAQSADFAASVTIAGWKNIALTSTYTATYDGVYYLAALYDPATQTPTTLATTMNWVGSPVMPSGQYRIPRAAAVASFPDPFVPTACAANQCCLLAVA